jgi:hypothetical protein
LSGALQCRHDSVRTVKRISAPVDWVGFEMVRV